LLIGPEVEDHLDPLDHQYPALCFYLSCNFGGEVIAIRRNLTRCQRAPKGAEQSTARCGHEVVERGGVGLLLAGGDAVVLGHLAVDAEKHWVCGWKVSAANLTPHRLHFDL
jgi:hypothetical protein